ncbi:hypothetical protein HN018_10725 [Lichenicola cladoniae]|uniref:Uncharacterized protein n=1 Tax=Lichenicola cladoniae TaxID=1484109 RepID=A0A6M8HQA0_9PROT|nr:hypothetical protein [Lichenicola cladoniae]NPD67840.1 hypothetical protein [Acetobacteraceae bacterium]QKE90445.1 hypothetical protein HN018_10725 [Lichenicola cladoniae]
MTAGRPIGSPSVTTAARPDDTNVFRTRHAPVSALPPTRVATSAPTIGKPQPNAFVDPVSTGSISRTGSIIEPMSLLFDTDWYRAEYPDVAVAGPDPIRHSFDDGALEGRNPNASFVTTWYLSVNADVIASNMSPFLHYLLCGAREGRQPAP